jgi:tRNA threonylcarbamoyladenosine biosynthesis protein TsaB
MESPSPLILAFDAAGRSCAAAIAQGEKVLAERLEPMERGQAERLVPMIEEVMAESGFGYADLDALAVTVGPGAFTGVRIGLAAARGFALALELPQIGVSSLEALAAATGGEERRGRHVLVLIDAKRRDFFAQLYDEALSPQGEPFSATPGTLGARLPQAPLLVVGDAAGQAEPALRGHAPGVRYSSAAGHVQAAIVARLALARYAAGGDFPPPGPLYLRAPDVTLPRGAK